MDGREMRHRLFGDEATRFLAESPTAILAPDWVDITDTFLFGMVWTRPGLDLPLKSLATISALIALGRERELGSHVKAGLRVGLTAEQILETVIQVAFYVGQPAAHGAFRAVLEAFADSDNEGARSLVPGLRAANPKP
jgi:alkylhydroperoxidase/carboxymuconolactone decarboxylase family protein YurZ